MVPARDAKLLPNGLHSVGMPIAHGNEVDGPRRQHSRDMGATARAAADLHSTQFLTVTHHTSQALLVCFCSAT